MPNSKKKAASGGGSIRKKTVIRNGKEYSFWEGRLTVGIDPGTGRQKQRSVSGKTQKEVAQKLRQLSVEVDNGTYQEPSKMTVGEWLDIWLDQYLGAVKPMTVKNYKEHVKNHLKPSLGEIKLSALKVGRIQLFYNQLSNPNDGTPGLSPKTVKCIHGILHKALQQAIAVGYLRTNPTEACVLPRIEHREISPLDDAGISNFLKAIRGHRFETLYLTMLFTGMRRGEICGLTWNCVDLDNGKLLINKQLQNIPGKPGEFRLISLKNNKGRSVALADSLVNELRKHKAAQDKMREYAGELWQETGFVFTNEVGDHLSPSTVYHQFKRIAETIGLPDARLHDLRHSFAVASLRAGDDIKTVQENLGHHTAAFTLDVYGHVTEEMKRDSANRIDAFIKSVSGQ